MPMASQSAHRHSHACGQPCDFHARRTDAPLEIIGCTQFGWLLALTLTEGHGKRRTLLIAADSIDADRFRQLAVSARRAARAYL